MAERDALLLPGFGDQRDGARASSSYDSFLSRANDCARRLGLRFRSDSINIARERRCFGDGFIYIPARVVLATAECQRRSC